LGTRRSITYGGLKGLNGQTKKKVRGKARGQCYSRLKITIGAETGIKKKKKRDGEDKIQLQDKREKKHSKKKGREEQAYLLAEGGKENRPLFKKIKVPLTGT